MRARPPRRVHKQRLWLAPLAYCLFAIALGIRGPHLGSLFLGKELSSQMSADSAIALLASVGTGMMALTGIVFSLVFVALQFGTTAYSPRLVDEFGRDRILPHGLGIFAGTFLYSVLAIRAVDDDGSINLPAVLIAFAWLVASVVVLVLLVPEIQGLSISKVLYRVGREGRAEAKRIYPPLDQVFVSAYSPTLPNLPVTQVIRHVGHPVHLLSLDEPQLVKLASRASGIVRVPLALGDPVLPDDPIAFVLAGKSEVSEKEIRRAVRVGKHRTSENNPLYALRLLADIAIRALSPAVNDPTTAVMSLDEIHSLLRILGNATLDIGRVTDEAGKLRLMFETPTWEDVLSLSLQEIRFYGDQSTQVQRRIGSLLLDLATRLPEARAALVSHLRERQETQIRSAFPGPEARALASARDRQGLGHTEAPR